MNSTVLPEGVDAKGTGPAAALNEAPEATRAVTRRDLFRGAFGSRSVRRVLTAAAGMAAAVSVTPSARATPRSADIDPGALLTKLVRRCCYSATPEELALANSLGYDAYLERHLNHLAINDSACDALLAPLTTLAMSPSDLYLNDDSRPTTAMIQSDLQDAALIRALHSKRQLFERMVEFWSDHFSIDIADNNSAYLKTVDDRTVARAHALGRFQDMLTASAMSPSMLDFLDNAISVASSPNENYAREILELHTMGTDGGYTQNDVREVARCFTGWTFWNSTLSNGVNAGTFRYRPERHDTNQKVVLGNIIPPRSAANGMQDGLDVINILCNHPSTASFLSRKMCNWILGEDTPTAIVQAVAATYTATSGDIKAMLRTMLQPGALFDAPPRFKRPFHLVASTLRSLPNSIAAYPALRTQLSSMGHAQFRWSPPDGYPNTLSYWSGLLLNRWNFGANLMNGTTGSISGTVVDDAAFYSGLTTADQYIARIDEALFQGEMPPLERARVRAFLATNPGSRTVRREAIGIAIASPGFQWY